MKRIERTIAVIITVLLLALAHSAQPPKVKFYPYGSLELCKGCGHLKQDYWRLKFRLENISGEDLTVYGQNVGDQWDFMNQVQYRNPHLCEWQYGHGTSERRVSWKDMSTWEKVPITLKAGEHLVSERGIDDYGYQPVTRFTAFIARIRDPEPYEIFSDAYAGVQNGDSEGKAPSFRTVDGTCTPECKIGVDQSPEINGIRLGMTLSEFRQLYPREDVDRLHKNVVNYKTASTWEWDRDAYSVRVGFLDDKVARIEASIRSLDGKRSDSHFFELVAEKIKLPFWPYYHSGWECKEFIVDVLTNEQPTITIQTKAFIKVQGMLAQRDIKKRK
jgi:hypothetical protein